MSMKNRLLAGTILGVAALAATPAHAQSQAELQKQIDALKQQLDDLQIRLGNKVNEVQKAQAEAPVITMNNGRPTFASSDGRFTMSLRGRFHYDVGLYFQKDVPLTRANGDQRGVRDLGSGTNFRRAELGVEGTVFRDWYYNLNFQFGGSGAESPGTIKEAYIQYRGIKPLRFTVGAYQEPLTMEDSTSSNDILFMERPEINNVITGVLGGEGRSAAGVQANDKLFGGDWFTSHYIVGALVGDAQSFDEQVGYAGRAAYSMPFLDNTARVHVGISGGYLFTPTQTRDPATATTTADYGLQLRDRPQLRVDGSRLIDTGSLNAQNMYTVGAELAGNWKSVYVQGEYYTININRERTNAALSSTNRNDENNFWGGYVQASWIVTGETRRYNVESASYAAPRPAQPFSFSGGGWGALELKARYSFISLNDGEGSPGTALANGAVRGGEEQIIGGGFNWYPNNNVRFMVDFLNVHVDRLTAAGLQQGQTFNALGIRTQFAF